MALERDGHGPIHDQVYETLHAALVTGGIVPGKGVTLRGLAAQLGVSAMPVRDAIRRIAAEGGLEIRANRRVYVPEMTRARLDELTAARLLLEPEAAARALPAIDAVRLASLKATDDAIGRAIDAGDVAGYMSANHRFHFDIYAAAASDVILPLVSGLWLRFGPFMRAVHARVGTDVLVDNHERALAAIQSGDESALRDAIRADIMDGMRIMRQSVAG